MTEREEGREREGEREREERDISRAKNKALKCLTFFVNRKRRI